MDRLGLQDFFDRFELLPSLASSSTVPLISATDEASSTASAGDISSSSTLSSTSTGTSIASLTVQIPVDEDVDVEEPPGQAKSILGARSMGTGARSPPGRLLSAGGGKTEKLRRISPKNSSDVY